ncbi:MAG: hypothetical protein ACI9TH_001957 [Kiritimatiellia bacterium]|jgi:hypothetical protein
MAGSENKTPSKHKTVITAVTPGAITSQRIHPHGQTTQKRIVINGASSKRIEAENSSVADLEHEEDVSDVQPAIIEAADEISEAAAPFSTQTASHKKPLLIGVGLVALIVAMVLVAMGLTSKKGPSLKDQAAKLKSSSAPGPGKPATSPPEPAPSPLTRGLIGHWTFDGEVKDQGSKLMESRYDGDAQFVPGVLGEALRLDGAHAVEVVPDTLVDKINRFYTISAWIRIPAGEAPAHFAGLVTRGDQSFRLSMAGRDSPGSIHLGHNSGMVQHMMIWGKRKDLNDGDWHHVIVIRDDNHLVSFVDGVQDGDKTEAVDDIQLTTAPLWIGGNSDFPIDPQNPNRAHRYFKGDLDDVRLYIRAFTPEEAQALFASAQRP